MASHNTLLSHWLNFLESFSKPRFLLRGVLIFVATVSSEFIIAGLGFLMFDLSCMKPSLALVASEARWSKQ